MIALYYIFQQSTIRMSYTLYEIDKGLHRIYYIWQNNNKVCWNYIFQIFSIMLDTCRHLYCLSVYHVYHSICSDNCLWICVYMYINIYQCTYRYIFKHRIYKYVYTYFCTCINLYSYEYVNIWMFPYICMQHVVPMCWSCICIVSWYVL